VKELLDEVEEIMKVMGVTSTVNDLENCEEGGGDVQGTHTAPPAPRVQDTKWCVDTKGANVNADEGANKPHETSAHTGHKVHPSKIPRVEPPLSDAYKAQTLMLMKARTSVVRMKLPCTLDTKSTHPGFREWNHHYLMHIRAAVQATMAQAAMLT
jgi:hypothetical protein